MKKFTSDTVSGNTLNIAWYLFLPICLSVVWLVLKHVMNDPLAKGSLTQRDIYLIVSSIIFVGCCLWAFAISHEVKKRYKQEFNILNSILDKSHKHKILLEQGKEIPANELTEDHYLGKWAGEAGKEQSASIMFQSLLSNATQLRYESDISSQVYIRDLASLKNKVRIAQLIAIRAGILFTFIGLFYGLGALSGDASAINQMVGKLIGGLYIAFSTSIAGLAASIFIQFLINLVDQEFLIVSRLLESAYMDVSRIFRQVNFNGPIPVSINRLSDLLVEHRNDLKSRHDEIVKQGDKIFEKTGEQLEEHLNWVEELTDDAVEGVSSGLQAHCEVIEEQVETVISKISNTLQSHSAQVISEINKIIDNTNSQRKEIADAIVSIGANQESMESLRKVHQEQVNQLSSFMESVKNYEEKWAELVSSRFNEVIVNEQLRFDDITKNEERKFSELNAKTVAALTKASDTIVHDIKEANKEKASLVSAISQLRDSNTETHKELFSFINSLKSDIYNSQTELTKAIVSLKTATDTQREDLTRAIAQFRFSLEKINEKNKYVPIQSIKMAAWTCVAGAFAMLVYVKF